MIYSFPANIVEIWADKGEDEDGDYKNIRQDLWHFFF